VLASVTVLASILATFFGGECYNRVIVCNGTRAHLFFFCNSRSIPGLCQSCCIVLDMADPNIMATETTFQFTMSFEKTIESEQRDHLLFDSGLYMGLGVGPIFGLV